MSRDKYQNIYVAIAIIIAISILDILTNSIDINKYRWDFIFYIDIAQHGLRLHDVSAPFIYRYATPMLAYYLHHVLGMGLYLSFKILAYIGLFLQLYGLFLFIRYHLKSLKAAIVSTTVVYLSVFNVKFLLFDPFRPDIFAYAFIIASVYAFFSYRYYLLLLLTLVGLQFREFVIVPMLAWISTLAFSFKTQMLKKYVIAVVIVVLVGIILPREIFVPIQNFQFINSLADVRMKCFSDIYRYYNWLYTITAYLLPTLMVLTKERIVMLTSLIKKKEAVFLTSYTLLIVILSFFGGTDFMRFVTYLFIPQAIILGYLVQDLSKLELYGMLLVTLLFNKTYMPIPMDSVTNYLDWYGGWHNRVNSATMLHIAEICLAIVFISLIRYYEKPKALKSK